MFIAVYEFEIKEGTYAKFRASWLEVTKAIYKYRGSYGSRLHTSENPNLLIGYAQWPSRGLWEREVEITDEVYLSAYKNMMDCLVQSKIAYQLEVSDDFLQPTTATA